MVVATEQPAAADLRTLRRNAVLTQAELAAKLGVGQRIVSMWENGEAMPRPGNIRKLAEALGITPREVLAALQRSAEREG